MTRMDFHHLAVVSIRTHRLIDTVHFYRDLIGLALLPHHGHQPAFDLGNGLYFVIVESNSERNQQNLEPRFPVLAFAVQNLDEVVHHLIQHKVKLPWGVEENDQNRWTQCFDPGGNLIEFVQMVDRRQ